MKAKKFNTRLMLNKNTIANLNNSDMNGVHGGDLTVGPNCTGVNCTQIPCNTLRRTVCFTECYTDCPFCEQTCPTECAGYC